MLNKDDQTKIEAFLTKSNLTGTESILQKRVIAVNESLRKTTDELQNLQNQVAAKQGEVTHLNGQLTGLIDLVLSTLDGGLLPESVEPSSS